MRFLLRLLVKLVKLVAGLVTIFVALAILGLVYGFATTGSTPVVEPSTASQNDSPAVRTALDADSGKYLRPEGDTLLSFPQWSVAFAARDYAEFLRDHQESEFPYLRYGLQYWQNFARAIRATAKYPVDVRSQAVLIATGITQTVDLLVQGAWENTVGWVTETLAGTRVGEDEVREALAHDYAKTIERAPWWEFPYSTARHLTWQISPAPGDGASRSWERKIAFGASDCIKQVVAAAIKAGVRAKAAEEIAVWAKGPVAEAIVGEADATVLADFGDDGAVFIVKQHHVLTDLAERVAAKGVSFVEIAGNRLILATVLGPRAIDHPLAAITVHFSQEVPAQPGTWRTGLIVPVEHLHELFAPLEDNGFRLEHLYDY